MIAFENVKYALLSGLFASTASTFGKLSGLSTFEGLFFLRVLFFICMLVCNGAVWTFFVKALQRTSSLTATVISSATNYIFSAVSGFCLFHEITSLLWWSGMFLIISGLILITVGESRNVHMKGNITSWKHAASPQESPIETDTAVSGFCLFHEITSLLWRSGIMFLIISGLILITVGESRNGDTDKNK